MDSVLTSHRRVVGDPLIPPPGPPPHFPKAKATGGGRQPPWPELHFEDKTKRSSWTRPLLQTSSWLTEIAPPIRTGQRHRRSYSATQPGADGKTETSPTARRRGRVFEYAGRTKGGASPGHSSLGYRRPGASGPGPKGQYAPGSSPLDR